MLGLIQRNLLFFWCSLVVCPILQGDCAIDMSYNFTSDWRSNLFSFICDWRVIFSW